MFVVKMPTAKIQWVLTFVCANLDTPGEIWRVVPVRTFIIASNYLFSFRFWFLTYYFLLFLSAEYFKMARILNFLKHWRSSATRLKIDLVIFILINLTIFAGNWIHFSYYSTLSKRKKFFKILRKQFFEEKQIVYFRKITLQYPLLRYQRVCYRRWCLWR